jgi:hypothetical protein
MREEWNEKHTLYLLIGQGISIWTSNEHILASIFAQLLGAPEQKAGLVLYSINNFYAWLTLIDELIAIDDHFTSIKDEWGGLSSKLKPLNDIRLRLAHHTSFNFDDSEKTVALRPSPLDARSKTRKSTPLTWPEINTFCDDASELQTPLHDLRMKIIRLASLPRKSS